MKIALDIMGGDHAPDEVIAGAVNAVTDHTGFDVILVGDQKIAEKKLEEFKIPARRLEFLHCTDFISMKDDPMVKKPDSSINRGLNLVKEQQAAAFVSAGNTGALMGNSLLTLGRITGIKRPAIAAQIPKLTGSFTLIDAGANSESKTENLEQFARMGMIFSREVHQKKDPSVGILNIGTEEKKGPREIQELYKILCSVPGMNFRGNIEGNSLYFSDIDVVVTDGFLGNIVLKVMEGFAGFLMKLFEQGLKEIDSIDELSRKKLLGGLLKKLDPSEYGGAPLLGLNGISIKAHGGSKRKAITNAILFGYSFAKSGALEKIKESFRNE